MIENYVHYQLTENVEVLRLLDYETKYFEALWEIPEGIAYNSYIVKSYDSVVLVDTWKIGYGDKLVELLDKIGALDRLTHIITHHLEPDHSGSLVELIKAKPDIIVVGHPLSAKLIESQYGIRVNFKPVRDKEELKLSNLHFSFYYTPWLHWPETIVSYLHNDKVFFTCDVFGSYGAYREKLLSVLNSEERSRYFKLARKYFANVVGHYRDFVLKSLNKLLELVERSEYIAPAHGLILERDETLYMAKLYEKWAKGTDLKDFKILVIYNSMYGFIEKLINKLVESLKDTGYNISTYAFTWNKRPLISEIIGDAIDASILIVGVSTYENKTFPLVEYTIKLLVHKVGCKKTIIIGTYGWSGKTTELKNILKNLGCSEVYCYETTPSQLLDVIRQVKNLIKMEAQFSQ
ncbi:MAG: FprA family A-type flavoprotein [Desulfurococcaceae archaeon]|nr:FprA family A-type flavoprotein [Desulfurococcaceae archaeon]